jgi:hypothetical protein
VITVTQSSLSTRFIQVLITTSNGYDPTFDNVQFAFTLETYPETQPTDEDWQTGSWAVSPGPQYWAQCLVGPANDGLALSTGLYQVWVKVVSDPEVPVLQDVYLQITP